MHVRVFLIDPQCLFDPSGLSLCLPGDDMVLFHSMVSDGGLASYTTLPSSGGLGLCAGCEGSHLFSVLLHLQAYLPACFPNVRTGAVLARDPVDQLGFLLIFDLVLWMNQDIPSCTVRTVSCGDTMGLQYSPGTRWFLGHVLCCVVNSQQDVNKMSDGHRNVIIR